MLSCTAATTQYCNDLSLQELLVFTVGHSTLHAKQLQLQAWATCIAQNSCPAKEHLNMSLVAHAPEPTVAPGVRADHIGIKTDRKTSQEHQTIRQEVQSQVREKGKAYAVRRGREASDRP